MGDISASEDDIYGGDASEESDIEDTVESESAHGATHYSREIIVVKPDEIRTTDVLSKFETTEIISIRGTQIGVHNNCMVDTTGLDDPVDMAKRELMMRACPLIVRRHVGEVESAPGIWSEVYEFRDPNKMIFSVEFPDVM